MNEWGPVVGILGITALIVAPFIVNKIIKFKLEVARINAQTTLKAEEIRAKNQLNIETIISRENKPHLNDYHNDGEYLDSQERIKRRV